MSALIGLDVGLYLDGDGRLIITDKPAPGLQPLSQSRGFRLHAQLDGVVTADVEIIVGGMDVSIPLEQARFVIADEEADAEMVRAVKRQIDARRRAAIQGVLKADKTDNRKVWIDVTVRWWARWMLARPFAWFWRAVGYFPRWAIRVRRVPPPVEQ